MKKDVIYIDIEDDITSIIEKIKGASAKIVALVPPKRTGALQSVVNLKLLQKAADTVDKRVVLITSDQALSALAAGVKIPVAKNLQSRPEVAPIAALEIDETDVINGEDLPIGDLARTSAGNAALIDNEELSGDSAVDRSAAAGIATAALASTANGTPKSSAAPAKKVGGGISGKIPNFDTFRKKLFILGGLGVFVVGFLVWALVFAPSATVTITANTNAVNVNRMLTLDPNAEVNIAEDVLKPEIKQIKKTISTDFDTTGTKEIGEKARGQVVLSNCESPTAQTIEAGTAISFNGLNYLLASDVTVPGGQGSFVSGCTAAGKSSPVAVNAQEIGSDYNTPTGTEFAVAGHSSQLTAKASTAIDGGRKETVNVVTDADVQAAQEKLEEADVNAVRKELADQFTGNVVVIRESFKAEPAQPSVVPAVGEQAKRARLSAETTYTLVALPRSDVDALLADSLEETIEDGESRRVYSSGSKTLNFSQFQPLENNTYAVQLSTTGYTGPVIDENRLKQQISGKRYGEIQQLVNGIEGVEDVDIQFSPFWVSKAPEVDKVNIKFTVKNDAE